MATLTTQDMAQAKLDQFYSVDNLVSIEVTMNEDVWEKSVLKAVPKDLPDPTHDGIQEGKHFEWVAADNVVIYGTKFPEKTEFKNVGIIKRSWYGSLSYTKPSLKLDFTKFNTENEATVKNLIGTNHLTLNNSKQDSAYIRQPLGYELFRQAGVPGFRCNFATVKVNGKFWGSANENETENTVTTRSPPPDGVYVNLEAPKKRFFKKCFKNDEGNLYKISYPGDFIDPSSPSRKDASQRWISFEGFSDHQDRRDMLVAMQEIQGNGLSGAKKVIDWEAYTRYLAMECLTRNWDSYSFNLNNAYMYNDIGAKADPDAEKGDIRFKFIPYGIDQILSDRSGRDTGILVQKSDQFRSTLAKLLFADQDAKTRLFNQIRTYATDIFGDKNLKESIFQYVNKEVDVLKSAGATYKPGDIEAVMSQLRLIQQWAYEQVGAPTAKA